MFLHWSWWRHMCTIPSRRAKGNRLWCYRKCSEKLSFKGPTLCSVSGSQVNFWKDVKCMICSYHQLTTSISIHSLTECSVLVPVCLRTPPPQKKIQSALIGQLTQAWASTVHSVSAMVFLKSWLCWGWLDCCGITTLRKSRQHVWRKIFWQQDLCIPPWTESFNTLTVSIQILDLELIMKKKKTWQSHFLQYGTLLQLGWFHSCKRNQVQHSKPNAHKVFLCSLQTIQLSGCAVLLR